MNSKLLREVLQNVSPEVQAESTRAAKEITAKTYAEVPLRKWKPTLNGIPEVERINSDPDQQKEIDRLKAALALAESALERIESNDPEENRLHADEIANAGLAAIRKAKWGADEEKAERLLGAIFTPSDQSPESFANNLFEQTDRNLA